MVDVLSIQSAMTSLETAANIAKGFLTLRDMAQVQSKVIELQSVIMSAQSSALTAQSEQFSLLQSKRELEEEMTRIKAWEETKQRYKLHEIESGCFAYGVKAESKGTEIAHWICATCFQDGHRVILQIERQDVGRKRFYVCPKCSTRLEMRHGDESLTPKYI